MKFQFKTLTNRQFACNIEGLGLFELVRGAYIQHRGTGQTPHFGDLRAFKRYVSRVITTID